MNKTWQKMISTAILVPVLCFCGCTGGHSATTQLPDTNNTSVSETTTITTASSSETETTAEASQTETSASDTTLSPTNIKETPIDNGIIQEATVDGISYSLTVDLAKWEGNTTEEQISVLEDLFWEVYPRMYKRFGIYSKAPLDVVLHIENEGYEIAEAWENNVHIHDLWLKDNPTDFDCFTHELAHVIQNGWDQEYLEYSGYIERFADYCRFTYAYKNGLYNDEVWDLQTVEVEPDRESSVRFLVWLDMELSIPDNDFMYKYFCLCTDQRVPASDWDKAWEELFSGTKFEGETIDQVFDLFASSDFAKEQHPARF